MEIKKNAPCYRKRIELVYVRACAGTYICLAWQGCQCVRSIFKKVGQLCRVL